MHDGKVGEDVEIKKVNSKDDAKVYEYKNITLLSKLILGIRNTYNVIPKFLLLFLVYFFLTLTLVGEYTGYKPQNTKVVYKDIIHFSVILLLKG